MTTQHLHQKLSAPGTFEFLRTLEQTSVTASPEEQILDMMAASGVEQPRHTFTDLVAVGVLQILGLGFGLSSYGIRTFVLLEALNGGDLRLAYQRLSNLDSTLHSYELVREGMTDAFLENIGARPGFVRLYICSPWIGLSARNRQLLIHAIHSAESRGQNPELLVLTRPDGDGNAPPGVDSFQELGATVFLNPRLHTKLYIREPGRQGGYSMAVVGSQNLTRSTYLELGIRINSDSAMIDQMIAYFWALSYESVEVGV